MTDDVIRVEHLSKRYTIGALKNKHEYLCDLMRQGLAALVGLKNGNSSTPMAGVLRYLASESPMVNERNDYIWALNDVSLNIKRGEVVGFIGQNGAGKSTLLKVLSRITEPTMGEVHICGRIGTLLEVGAGFHSELTGRENVYLSGAVLGMKKREIDLKFDEIVAFAGVEKFLDTQSNATRAACMFGLPLLWPPI
jgi:lipopolysaccharide transport system ATP-binding protein